MIARFFLALPLLLPALVGCGNAAIDDKVARLPDDGLPPSAFHRAGQPCLLCHGQYGGASPQMVIAGSVFAAVPTDPGTLPIPINGAQINFEDASGNKNAVVAPAKLPEIKTNCAGNFYLTRDQVFAGLAPAETVAFPLKVEVECPDGTRRMNSRIARDGSCGGCHAGSPSQDSPGLIVCGGNPTPPDQQSCPDLFR